MFNRPKQKSNWRNEYPIGALKTREEVLDLVIEARKSKRAIRFYTVNQSGSLGIFYITSKTRLLKKGSPYPKGQPLEGEINDIGDKIAPTYSDHSKYFGGRGVKNRFCRTDGEFLGSYGIVSPGSTEHRLFTNRMAAEKYSKALSSDPVYMNEVKEWHAYCDRMFNHDYD